MTTVANYIAKVCVAAKNCEKNNSKDWERRWHAQLDYIEKNILPSGAGLDAGSKIYRDNTNEAEIFIKTSFHHMDDAGGYDGWTDHLIKVRATFLGVKIDISGQNLNGIKKYLGDVFGDTLGRDLSPEEKEALRAIE